MLQFCQEHSQISTAAGLLLLLSLIFYSYLHILLVLWAFIVGSLFVYLVFSPDSLLPNVLIAHTRIKKVKHEDELALLKKVCPVCGKQECKRHRPELNIVALQPWTNLKIPEKVDVALEEFLEIVLKEFVYTWYKDLSQDEAFVTELRTSLRFIAAVLLRRFQKVDLPNLIINKVLKVAMRHLDCHLRVRLKGDNETDEKCAKHSDDIQQLHLEELGPHLHCALRNRRAELDYLRRVTENIFPYILPIQSLKCKSLCVLIREVISGGILLSAMDVLADPDMVNNLLLVFFDKSPPPVSHDPPSPEVTILANFAHTPTKTDSCLNIELSEILGDPSALYPFMQFLKKEASVNVLQFYLSVEEFNTKVLTPELSDKQLEKLHAELTTLYDMYFAPNSIDRIMFDDDVVQQIEAVLAGPPESVLKLQTSTPLFRAYEHAYDLLENTFLPLFHQSDDYYQMICGERLPTRLQRSASRTSKKGVDNLGLSKIGSKLKGVFKTNTVEGKMLNDVDFAMDLTDPTLRSESIDDEDLSNGFDDMDRMHNLSAWRVTVPRVIERPDPENPKKLIFLFTVEVIRLDITEDELEPSSWIVLRKYNEFYVLEQKLREFHGEFPDAQLQTKKAFGTKNKDFLDSKREMFQQYLQALLTKPILRGSELLHNFLSSDSDLSTGFLPELNLGKMFKSGAMKLVKERGQHLDPFLQSVLSSAEGQKPKPSRSFDMDSDTVSLSSEKMSNSIYDNNADKALSSDSVDWDPVSNPYSHPDISSAFDAVVYLAENVFEGPDWFINALHAFGIVGKNSLDNYLDWFLDHKLKLLGQEHRVVFLVHLLRDVLFFKDDPPRTDEEKRIRRQKTLEELQEFIPRLFRLAVGEECHAQGSELIFSILQQPKLNKQLIYILLDIVLEELFPELKNDQLSDPYTKLLRNDDDH